MVSPIIRQLLTTPGSQLGKNRISRDELFMSMARLVSYRGTCNRGGRPGCVIVKDGRVVSIGYVGSPPMTDHCLDKECLINPPVEGCLRTQHAEANAIAWAARSGISLDGASLYLTLMPCLLCAKLIIMSGIKEVIYLDDYRDLSGLDYIRSCAVTSSMEIRKYR
jgi:dCMP deaminase